MAQRDAPETPPDVAAALRWAVEQLRFAIGADAGRDARRLLEGLTGLDGVTIVARPETRLDAGGWGRFQAGVARRAQHEPVARILGIRGFYGRLFEVTPDTLDPRPETETVVDTVLSMLKEAGRLAEPLRILDVGTGTGVLLVTLLAELRQAFGIGSDVSAAALAVAASNALRHGVAGRAEFIEARGLDGLEGPFDVVVSNPPYIPSGDIAGLAPEVRSHDPLLALDGGADGLAVYRDLATGISRLISRASSSVVAVEVGQGQAPAVGELIGVSLARGGMVHRRIVADLGGVQRCVAFWAQATARE